MKRHVCVSLAAIAAHALNAPAGTVVVETLSAETVRTATIATPPAATCDAELYYPFEESTGAVVLDVGTNGYDGAASGCVWTNAGRYVGGAMAFDGYNDSISVGAAPNFPLWNQYSVSLWFLHNGGGDTGPSYGHKMLDKTSFYHDWYLKLGRTDNGCIGLTLYESGVSSALGDYSYNYMDNLWHHVVVVRDGVNGQFWVDGALKHAITNMISVNSSSSVCVGCSFSTDSYQRKSWSGLLDEVMVFNRPLTPLQIANLHEEGALFRSSILMATNVVVSGNLVVTGDVFVATGSLHLSPRGDLASGSYTNAP